MIYNYNSKITINHHPDLKDYKFVIKKKKNWLIIKDSNLAIEKKSKLTKVSSNTNNKNFRYISPETIEKPSKNNLSRSQDTVIKPKSRDLSNIKIYSPGKSVTINNLEQEVKILELENKYLQLELEQQDSSEILLMLKSELELKNDHLVQVLEKDMRNIEKLENLRNLEEDQNISSNTQILQYLKTSIKSLTQLNNENLKVWRNRISEAKEKLSTLSSQISFLTQELKTKDLFCRKLVLDINSYTRSKRKTPVI